jgi:hypothetical protein
LATNTLIADLTSTISILSHRSTISRQEEPPLTYFPPLPTSPSFSQLKVPTSSSHSRHQWPIPPSTPPYFSLSIDYFSFFLHNSCCYPIFDPCFNKFSEKFKNSEKH